MSFYVPDPFLFQQGLYGLNAKTETDYSTSTIVYGLDLIGTDFQYAAVRTGSQIVMVHITDRGADLASLGQPNVSGNPWRPVTSADYGPDGPKIRVWTKLATALDQSQNTTYTITVPTASKHRVFYYVWPPGLFDPVVTWPTATSKKFGLPHTHPPVKIPDGYRNLDRNYGFGLGIIAAAVRPSQKWTNPNFFGADNAAGWYGQGDPGPSPTADAVCAFAETAIVGLDPNTSMPQKGPLLDTYWQGQGYTGNCPTVSVSILFLPWTSYKAPVDGPIGNLTDNYSTALDSRVTTVGSPTVDTTNKQLVLHGGDRVTYAGTRSLKESSLTIEAVQVAVTGSDTVSVILESRTWPGYNRIFVSSVIPTTGSVQGNPAMRIGVYDNQGVTYTYDVFYYANSDPSVGADRWWRIREEGGALIFDTSPDKVNWRTRFEKEHGLLDDQLGDMTLSLAVTGSSSTTAIFDNLGAPFSWQPGTVPTERTQLWMGATPALRSTWHGRNVLMGICDQGTSKATRDAAGITMVDRIYLGSSGLPPARGNGETFQGQTHGCLVTPNGVPTGGKFVEAVISGYEGGASTSSICRGLIWCAQKGAKVVNLSFGGGGADQAYVDTFNYIAANFDCEIFIAAGNSTLPYPEIPAAYSALFGNVHSVAAFNEVTSTRASFSNYWAGMSGCAPGYFVTSYSPSGRKQTWSGTSAASPHSASLASRLCTGGTYTPAHVGRVLDQNARQLPGVSRDDQGNGAYDLGLSAAVINLPEKGLQPDIAMPRFVDGQYVDVAEGFNEFSDELERADISVLVRRTSYAILLDSGIQGVMLWETADVDTAGGVWIPDDPQVLYIEHAGLYEMTACCRFGYTKVDGTVVTGAPYNAGSRTITICLNGTDPATRGIANARLPASTDGEGVTLSCTTQWVLYPGDYLFVTVFQNSGQTIEVGQNDFCGTYFSIDRVAPLAPTLSGTASPVTNFTATANNYASVALAWTNPAVPDHDAVLIRRKVGTSGPSGILDGSPVATVSAPGQSFTDTTVAGSTTYTYGAFARTTSYVYATAALATVAVPAAPPPPNPVTNLTATVTTTTETLTWTNPTSANFTGCTIRRAAGSQAPLTPSDGSFVAETDSTTNTYTDKLLTPYTVYSYSVFSHSADPVYSAAVSITKKTTVDVTIHGSLAPSLTSIRTDKNVVLLARFKLTRPGSIRAHRFYRPNTTVAGPLQFAVYDAATGTRPPYVDTDGSVIGTKITMNPASTGWLVAVLPAPVALPANRPFWAAVLCPNGFPEYTPFWSGSAYGGAGLQSTENASDGTDGILIFPQQTGTSGYANTQESIDTTGKTALTSSVSAGPGGAGGPCWWHDVIINPAT